MNEAEILGKTRTHIKQIELPRFAAQAEVVEAFLDMSCCAKKDGIQLVPFSSFRDFKTQLRIWNKKYKGEKPLFDQSGKQRNFVSLTENEIIDCILNWSALPGASRHHWGTEIDVVDAAVMPENYRVQLLPQEIEPGGLFYNLHLWLDENMAQFGFFRPYSEFKGGMYPEPWHLSYSPLSVPALQELKFELLQETIKKSNIFGKELLLNRLPSIFENHVININFPDSNTFLRDVP